MIDRANKGVLDARLKLDAAQEALAQSEQAAVQAQAAAAQNPQAQNLLAAQATADQSAAAARHAVQEARESLQSWLEIQERARSTPTTLSEFGRLIILDYISPNLLPFMIGLVLVVALFSIGGGCQGCTKGNQQAQATAEDQPERAKETITVYIGAGTIAVALILVLTAMLRADVETQERFRIGKDVLTALIGVFGTIVGFYFSHMPDKAPPSGNSVQKANPTGEPNGDESPGNAKKPAVKSPSDKQPGDDKPADTKPSDTNPGDTKPGDAGPGEKKSGDKSGSAGGPADKVPPPSK